MKFFITTFLFIAAILLAAQAVPKKTVCYWQSVTLSLNEINPSICTHLMYAFIGCNAQGVLTNTGSANIPRLATLKQRNPALKIFASFGGAAFPSSVFRAIAASPAVRATFASNVLVFLQKNNIDGIDLDWEFPEATDKANFVFLLTALRNKLHPAGKMLTIAVAPDVSRTRSGYNIPQVVAQVDFINMMTYDFHQPIRGEMFATNLHSAIYSVSGDYSIDVIVNYWLAQGAPANKLIVGIPLYGRAWTLKNPNVNGIGANATGPGSPDKAITYNQVCNYVRTKGWKVVFVPSRGAAYSYGGNQWTTYDEAQTMDAKSNYIVTKNLGGAMFWSLHQDDTDGSCGGGTYPMVTRVYNRMR